LEEEVLVSNRFTDFSRIILGVRIKLVYPYVSKNVTIDPGLPYVSARLKAASTLKAQPRSQKPPVSQGVNISIVK
jgi:hypothetical protein